MFDKNAILTGFECFLSFLQPYLISTENVDIRYACIESACIRNIYIKNIIEYLEIYLQSFQIFEIRLFNIGW